MHCYIPHRCVNVPSFAKSYQGNRHRQDKWRLPHRRYCFCFARWRLLLGGARFAKEPDLNAEMIAEYKPAEIIRKIAQV